MGDDVGRQGCSVRVGDRAVGVLDLERVRSYLSQKAPPSVVSPHVSPKRSYSESNGESM